MALKFPDSSRWCLESTPLTNQNVLFLIAVKWQREIRGSFLGAVGGSGGLSTWQQI